MAVYWINFRIHEDSGYERAYDALTSAVNDVVDVDTMWCETTSFYLAECDLDIDGLASVIKRAIRPDRDLAVVGMPFYKAGRVIGKCADRDIFALAPFMKKV